MNLGNYVDLVILFYLVWSFLYGLKNGLLRSLILSLGFLIKVIATFIITKTYYYNILDIEFFKNLIFFFRKVLIKNKLVQNFSGDILDKVVFVIILYSILTFLLYILSNTFKGKDDSILKSIDKILGGMFLFLKAVVFVMFIVFLFDKTLSGILSFETKDALASSKFLPKFYSYNIFMYFF